MKQLILFLFVVALVFFVGCKKSAVPVPEEEVVEKSGEVNEALLGVEDTEPQKEGYLEDPSYQNLSQLLGDLALLEVKRSMYGDASVLRSSFGKEVFSNLGIEADGEASFQKAERRLIRRFGDFSNKGLGEEVRNLELYYEKGYRRGGGFEALESLSSSQRYPFSLVGNLLKLSEIVKVIRRGEYGVGEPYYGFLYQGVCSDNFWQEGEVEKLLGLKEQILGKEGEIKALKSCFKGCEAIEGESDVGLILSRLGLCKQQVFSYYEDEGLESVSAAMISMLFGQLRVVSSDIFNTRWYRSKEEGESFKREFEQYFEDQRYLFDIRSVKGVGLKTNSQSNERMFPYMLKLGEVAGEDYFRLWPRVYYDGHGLKLDSLSGYREGWVRLDAGQTGSYRLMLRPELEMSVGVIASGDILVGRVAGVLKALRLTGFKHIAFRVGDLEMQRQWTFLNDDFQRHADFYLFVDGDCRWIWRERGKVSSYDLVQVSESDVHKKLFSLDGDMLIGEEIWGDFEKGEQVSVIVDVGREISLQGMYDMLNPFLEVASSRGLAVRVLLSEKRYQGRVCEWMSVH